VDLFEALGHESEKRSQEPVPLASRQLLASFKGERGEGDGVTRGLLAAASDKVATGDKSDRPYFCMPGKAGFYAPVGSESCSESRRAYYANVGRLVGLSLLHNLPISLGLTRPTIKFMLGRQINWTDLAFHSPDLYENFRKMILASSDDTTFAEAGYGDLTFEVTGDALGGNGSSASTIQLMPDGAQKVVTASNVKIYVMLYAEHRLFESIKAALAAMKAGLEECVPNDLLVGLSAEDFALLLSGCGPRVEVRWLKLITTFKDARADPTPDRPLAMFERLYWAAVSSMSDAERRELLYFATGSPVHPHDFGGRKLAVHVKSDVSMLPSAQTCTLEMNVPFYPSQTELTQKLLTSFKCETYDYV